jgi:hypothetical protein
VDAHQQAGDRHRLICSKLRDQHHLLHHLDFCHLQKEKHLSRRSKY